MMLVVSAPFEGHIVLIYLAGCIGATVLEYVTGALTEALFKVRYWDYSNQILNFRGLICLSSTVAWGFFTILMTEVIHKPIERLADGIPGNVLFWITLLLTVCASADFALSFKAALDMRDILDRLESARWEMERMQKRLDVLIAIADQAVEEEREELRMKFGILRDRREQLKNTSDYYRRRLLLDNPGMISSKFRDTLEELKEAVREHKNKSRNR